MSSLCSLCMLSCMIFVSSIFLLLFFFFFFFFVFLFFFFFQAEDGIRDAQESRGLGDVYKRQIMT